MSERFGKAAGFVVRQEEPLNGGPPIAAVAAEFVTPTPLFFVRGHSPVPRLEPGAVRLRVAGAVARPFELSPAELAERFERVTVTAALQCAGLRRDELMAATDIPGELPWSGDAIGTAVWGGVRLADVLAAAGPGEGPAAAHVAFTALDRVPRPEGDTPFGASIPREKALAPEVLLADTMNGEPLPAVHGGPLRLVVPGYIGARSVKWLGEVRVQAEPSDNHFQSSAYRFTPGRPDEPAPAVPGPMLGDLRLTSAITVPAAGIPVTAGPLALRGWAITGGGARVERVEVSADGGATWRTARLLDEGSPWTWRRWQAEVDLTPGPAELVVRAFDSAGGEQPPELARVWNRKGYMNNAWHRVPVRAAADG